MKRLLLLFFFLASLAGAQTFTYPCQECNNTYTGTNTFNGAVTFSGGISGTVSSFNVNTLTVNTTLSGAASVDFRSTANVLGHLGTGYATLTNGEFGYDLTNKNWHFFDNGVDALNVVVPASVSLTNNDCAKWTVAAGVVTLNDNGGPCASTIAVASNQFLTGYNASTGAFSQAQPSFGNISGSIALSQIVNLGTTTTVLHGNAAGNAAFSGVSLTADTSANQGTTTTLLHGNAAGQPSFASVVSADLNITPTSCTNQFLTAISSTAGGTCTPATLASAQFANQGTTTTLLHGNAAGNPSFGAVSLTTGNDVTGVLPQTNGGTGVNGGSTVYPTGGTVTSGTGTVNVMVKFTNGASSIIGNSAITDNGSVITSSESFQNIAFLGTETGMNLTGATTGNTVEMLNAQGAVGPQTGNSTDQVLYTYSLPANVIDTTSKALQLRCAMVHSSGTTNSTLKMFINGQQILAATSGTTASQSVSLVAEILRTASTTGGSWGAVSAATGNSGAFSAALTGLAWGSPQTVTCTENVANTDQWTGVMFTAKQIQ